MNLKLIERKIDLKKIGFIFLVFFYVYDVLFSFLPLSTNVLFAIPGFCLLVLHITRNLFIQKNNVSWIVAVILMLLWSILCVAINQTDFSFLIDEVLRNMFIPFVASFFIVYCGKDYLHSVQDVLKTILFAVIMQSFITIIAFFTPIGSFIRSFQTLNKRMIDILDTGIRAYGLGSGFDFGSFVISYGLIITSYFYLTCEKSKRGLYIAIYILLTFAGLLMARSIILGICFSLVFIVLANTESIKKFIFIIRMVFVVLAIIGAIWLLFPGLFDTYSLTIEWISEIFDLSSSRTYNVIFNDMYFVPESFRTWFIGDGLYLNESGAPYMNTDPLYMRYLLFFGVPGLIIFIFFIVTFIVSLRADNSYLFGKTEQERRLYNIFLAIVLALNLAIYVKLDSHSFYLLFYLLWFLHFKYVSRKNKKYIVDKSD